MGKASRDKGKRGEREVAHLFRRHGLRARRTQQVDGGLSSDVICGDLPEWHIEVKRRNKVAAFRFLEQAENDCSPGTNPVVFLREDGVPRWGVLMDADLFIDLISRPRE